MKVEINPDKLYCFEEALWLLKNGCKMQNQNWNGKDMYLVCQYPDEDSLMDLPYIYMVHASGHKQPWLASQMDLFSDGWRVYLGKH